MRLTWEQSFFAVLLITFFLLFYNCFLLWKNDRLEKENHHYRRNASKIRLCLNLLSPWLGDNNRIILTKSDIDDLKYFTYPPNFPHKNNTISD